MISKNLKVFEVEGEKYQFDIDEFKRLFAERSARQKKKIGDYEQEMGDFLFVGKDTVHNWRNKLNGPGDFDKIRGIANFLRCDVMNLMKKVVEDNEMSVNTVMKLDDRQRDAVRRVYLAIQRFIREFYDTFGFKYATVNTPVEHTMTFEGDENIYYDYVYVECEKVYDDLIYVLEDEFVDIPFSLWSDLHIFIYENLFYLHAADVEYLVLKENIIKDMAEDTDTLGADVEDLKSSITMEQFLRDRSNELSHKIITIIAPYLQ